MRPLIVAIRDCMVLRKMENVKRSFDGPYVIVVMRSWRIAHVRLGRSLANASKHKHMPSASKAELTKKRICHRR